MSLTSKVLWIFVGALILLGALAWGFSKPWRGPWRDQLPKVLWINMRAHLIGVASELQPDSAIEIDLAKAKPILDELRLELLVMSGGKERFRTSKQLPDWKLVEEEVLAETERWAARPQSLRSKLGDFVVGRAGGRMFAMVSKEGSQFTFFIPERDGFLSGLRAFSGFAFTIAFLLIVILGMTHWLLRPMKPLIVGVNEISNGNFGYRFGIKAEGEFGALSGAFNTMAERIQLQLRAKDQLLMDVSHELRSPLGRIKMATEMLGDEALKPQIKDDIREMEELIAELLEIYRVQETAGLGVQEERRIKVDIGRAVRDVIEPFARNSPGIEYRMDSDEMSVHADLKPLMRAIRNVVENAVKFSRHQTSPVQVRVGLSKDDSNNGRKYVEIEIRDFGIGMSGEQQTRIFEPFYRADSSRVRETGGFGLGLPLARAIVRSHRGTIECESQLDKGTVFRIYLPCA